MFRKIEDPFVLTLFGASGDLAKIKIFPSLFALAEQNRLPKNFCIVGFSRKEMSQEDFRKEFLASVQIACERREFDGEFCDRIINTILENTYYFQGQYDNKEDFIRYRKLLETIAPKEENYIHAAYFSVPPSVFQPIIQNLAESRKDEKENIRIILEKPFGEDEESATDLFHFISQYFESDQVFLLDHYLGKSAVQSILSLRHTNAILNAILKGREIASIQISANENMGVENRIGYFDQVGIIKDMFQSHLTQILAMITMSIPIMEDAESFQREKYAILSALKFSEKEENLYIGQYESYSSLKGIQKHSKTETFMAVKLKIDRESWYGVPIFIRTGQRLKKKATYAVIEFKKLPFQKQSEPNRLIFEFFPNETLHIKLINQYGDDTEFHDVTPTESIACRGSGCLPEHAALLLDVLRNERLHFLSFPEVIAAWKVTDSILNFCRQKKIPFEIYPEGVLCPEGGKKIFREKEESWYEL
jgi:glucose-6-phosphate 1-dehydrogenase